MRGGYLVKEHGRLVVLWRTPHVELAPRLEAIITDALTVAGDAPLAYPRPSGDWLEPKPRSKIMSYVRGIAKQNSNATLNLASFDEAALFALEYLAYLPVWIDGHSGSGRGSRGHASSLCVTFPRERFYEQPAEMTAWFSSMLSHAPFSAATLGLALEGHEETVYPLALQHGGLDISDVSCVSADIADAIPNVAWLTALGEGVLARVGGVGELARAMAGHGEVVDVAGGAVVMLGKAPSRGSTDEELAPFRALANILGPELHVPRDVSYFSCGFADGSDRYQDRELEMQEAWHRRFFLTSKQLLRVFSP